MENPIKMDDLGIPLFSETSRWLHKLEPLNLAPRNSVGIQIDIAKTWETVCMANRRAQKFKISIRRNHKGDILPWKGTLKLHPWKLTWHWKIPMFTRKYIFKWWMFHCHVSFRGTNASHFAPENRPGPKRKRESLPTIHVQAQAVSFKGSMF